MEILFSNVESIESEETQQPEPEEEHAPEEERVEEVRTEEERVEEERVEEERAEEERAEEERTEEEVVAEEEGDEEAEAEEEGPSILKVASRSRPSAVAGAIAGVVREVGRAELQSIGAGATNQAVKAVAIARSYLEEDGIDVFCIPSFVEVMIDQEERTAIRLVVEQRD